MIILLLALAILLSVVIAFLAIRLNPIQKRITEIEQKRNLMEPMKELESLIGGICHDYPNMGYSIIGLSTMFTTRYPNQTKSSVFHSLLDENAPPFQKIAAVRKMLGHNGATIELNSFLNSELPLISDLLQDKIKITREEQFNTKFWFDQPHLSFMLYSLFLNLKKVLPSGGEIKISLKKRKLRGVHSLNIFRQDKLGLSILFDIRADQIDFIYLKKFTAPNLDFNKYKNISLLPVIEILKIMNGTIKLMLKSKHKAQLKISVQCLAKKGDK